MQSSAAERLNRRKFGLAAAAASAASTAGIPVAASHSAERAERMHITLLHFTDIHAQLETHPEYLPGETPAFQMLGGYARLKTALDRQRNDCSGACFVVDGGDEFQGSGPAAWSEGEVIVEPLNALASDIFVPGNWEAAYGPARFKDQMSRLRAQVTCFNLHDSQTNKRLFKPAVTLERNGVKVSFVGITDILASKRQPPVQFAGLDTTRLAGLRDFVQELRSSERPHLVVAVMHTGITISRQLARDIPEFDVVLSGHTHERTERPVLEGTTIIVEPGSCGSFLGRLDLELNPNGGVAKHRYQFLAIRAAEYPEDAAVKALVDKALAPHRDKMNEIVGRSLTPLLRYDVLETNADDFITDAVRAAAESDIGLSNGFRFAPPVLAGDVRNADLWNLLPMDARLKSGWITGKELRNHLEHELELVYSREPMTLSGGWGPRASGMTVRFSARAQKGSRVQAIFVGGAAVDDDKHYTVASCEREGEPLDIICRIRGVHDAKILPTTLHEALRAYLKEHPVISPLREGRAYATDLGPVVFSQDAVVSEGSRGSYLPCIAAECCPPPPF